MQNLRRQLFEVGQQDLLKNNIDIKKNRAARVIKRFMFRWWINKKSNEKRNAAALKIQKFYKGRFDKNSSFINALNLSKCPRIFFLKE